MKTRVPGVRKLVVHHFINSIFMAFSPLVVLICVYILQQNINEALLLSHSEIEAVILTALFFISFPFLLMLDNIKFGYELGMLLKKAELN